MMRLVRKVSSQIALAVVLTVILPVPGLTEITEVRVGIEGAMCPHCAANLQKALSRLGGVDRVEVTLDPPQATFEPKAGWRLDAETLKKAVAETEFRTSWIRFEAVGLLTLKEGVPALKVQGTEQVIPLESDRKLDELMMTVRQDCQLVFIRGVIPEGRPTARIERFEVRGLLGHPC